MPLLDFLKLPEVKNVADLDDPSTTILREKIMRRKPFLEKLYVDFYLMLQKSVGKENDNRIIELGSGGGFLKEVIPNAVTSDILKLSNVDCIFNALKMPFRDDSIDAFVMIDVLHHLPDPEAFFTEARRTLTRSGKIVMIEPASTAFGLQLL